MVMAATGMRLVDASGQTRVEMGTMGCDIHWYSETRHYRTPEKIDPRWHCDQGDSLQIIKEDNNYPQMDDFPNRTRDYWFFGLLFNGVRTDWTFAFPGKCLLPTDLSSEVQAVHDYWGKDAHSQNWLTRKELEDKLAELHLVQAEMLINPRPYETTAHVQHMIGRLKETIDSMLTVSPDADSEDHRLVFWFDN